MGIEFSKDFERQLKRAAEATVRQWAKDHQPELDEFGRRNEGRPVADIKRDLVQLIASWGGNFSEDDPTMSTMANAIHAGERVQLRPGRVA
ncbi:MULTISPECIES: hypothetical protein [Mycobacteriaceae]|jgi:hypothetical protein|uniref:Uncharacterized protein n=1 Tax=Mycolicibacterium mucogenicum TaxID=56689 RepID=A0A1A0MQY0_MYCMU|nr:MULTISPECIES: hypothetical protein [Mycobacteriaceae]TXH24212.1 MAG: hypothetical protein E6R06_13035 [Mycobacterium sp.]OBA87797.1 hypothetical protein A5642_18725 [Mycolicibacterium mucogenicum]SHO84103.1 Uncharacterised protein [Mycobacteroides abscessus subsp. abscessus]SHP00490.1 Uncharacterised protein [Mycobacteroides abscessus subsp. abscessus]SHP51632.1 Uncharacterised protein [Mycobacteroides abscessus subsp. abscessus]